MKIERIVKQYLDFKLDIEHLDITDHGITGIVGNNGAGKSTLLKLMLDLIPPTEGRILYKDKNVRGNPHWKPFVSAYLDESFLLEYLTAKEYWSFVQSLYPSNINLEKLLQVFKTFIDEEMPVSKKKRIRDYSQGNRAKIGVLAAFIGNPELIILDEPFAHLDPRSQLQLMKVIGQYSVENNSSFIISSHNLDHISQLSNRILLFEKGNIIRDIVTNEETLAELTHYFTQQVE